MQRKTFHILILLCLLLFPTIVHASLTKRVTVYVTYSICSVCPDDPMRVMYERYLDKLWALRELNADIQMRTIDVEPELERDLAELYQKIGVPEDIPTSLTLVVSIDEKYVFINHVPVRIIYDFLAKHSEKYGKLVVYKEAVQDLYKVVDDVGNVLECEIENSVAECFTLSSQDVFSWSTLSLVVFGGLLDSVNPCAFTVMLFFITLLYIRGSTIWDDNKMGKSMILLFGSTYILAIYLSYLIIGLTLLEVIRIIPFPHLASKLGGFVVLLIGLIKIGDVFWPGRWISLKLSPSQWDKISVWMRRVSLPTTFTVGVLVALFEFPCTGGIYIAILSILSTKTVFAKGLTYLLIYNAAFIFPLIAILILAIKIEIKHFSLRKWQQEKGKHMGALESLIYIGLGFFMLFSGLV